MITTPRSRRHGWQCGNTYDLELHGVDFHIMESTVFNLHFYS